MSTLPEQQNKALIVMAATLALGLLVDYGMKTWSLSNQLATPAGQLKLAEQAYGAGHDRIALTLFEGLAKKGDPNAEYWLARMKDRGIATPQDVADALPLYAKAAKLGNSAAASRIGEIYLDGYKVPQAFEKARTYLEKAARLHNPRAATELARMYATGLGVAKDPKWAYAWYEAAVIEGSYIARHERDQLIAAMPADVQKQAMDEASRLLAEIKTSPAPEPPAGAKSTDPGPTKSH